MHVYIALTRFFEDYVTAWRHGHTNAGLAHVRAVSTKKLNVRMVPAPSLFLAYVQQVTEAGQHAKNARQV